ncbi:protrudin-like [Sycon ciliatum]|uniref:protrudin-like n=1 Tax=Sycon ciliatum TaxID=27933 RepID=UPI0031F693A8
MAEADTAENNQEAVTPTLDIAAFVADTAELQQKLRVFGFLWLATEYVLSWKSPWISVLALVLVEVICVWPTLLPFLVLLAVCALFGRRFLPIPLEKRVTSRYPAAQIYTANEDDAALARQDAAAKHRTEILQQYRVNLILIHAHFSNALSFILAVDRLLLWEDKASSRRWLCVTIVVLMAMIVLPWQYICGVAVAFVFLYNSAFFALLRRKRGAPPSTKEITASADNESPVNGTQNSENVPGEPTAISEQPDSAAAAENSDNGDDENSSASANIPAASSVGKPGVVSRLKALRQRRKITKESLCAGCLVSLSGILRKRCYCRHCGQDFCATCCNKEVPRAFLGATAPAAKTETVLVCHTCHEFLTTHSQSPAQQRARSRSAHAAIDSTAPPPPVPATDASNS